MEPYPARSAFSLPPPSPRERQQHAALLRLTWYTLAPLAGAVLGGVLILAGLSTEIQDIRFEVDGKQQPFPLRELSVSLFRMTIAQEPFVTEDRHRGSRDPWKAAASWQRRGILLGVALGIAVGLVLAFCWDVRRQLNDVRAQLLSLGSIAEQAVPRA